MAEKYTYSIHQSGYITVKNLLQETVAVIDYDERLSFTKKATSVVKKEVKDFLDMHDIAYFL